MRRTTLAAKDAAWEWDTDGQEAPFDTTRPWLASRSQAQPAIL
jgi:hypothetical protein